MRAYIMALQPQCTYFIQIDISDISMKINIRMKPMLVFFFDFVGPVTHKTVQTNYHTTLMCGIQYVCTACCVQDERNPKISIQYLSSYLCLFV